MHAHSHVCDVRAKMLSNSMSAVCAALFRVYISDLSVYGMSSKSLDTLMNTLQNMFNVII